MRWQRCPRSSRASPQAHADAGHRCARLRVLQRHRRGVAGGSRQSRAAACCGAAIRSPSTHACPVLGRAVGIGSMARLEEITYEAGRHALADQEALVSGIRQRTGTLLAAHALVASFLGAAVIRAHGLDAFGWIALGALVLGLGAAAVLLAPWDLKFAMDARELYSYSPHRRKPKPTTTVSAGWSRQVMAIRRYCTRNKEGSVDVSAVGCAGDPDDRADSCVAGRAGGRMSP